MKKLVTSFGILIALVVLIQNDAQAQQKVTEKKLLGTWKLVIDIEEAMDEAKEEMDEEDNILGEMILSGVSGLVEGIIDNIDIYFEFRPNGELIVNAEAFGEEEEDPDVTNWYINSRGELIIEDSDKMQSDDDEYWLFDGKYLVNYDREGREENVYMRKVE